ncbi:MAG: hypothetical protein K5745_07650 [Saccharofermentans sp.]|nr:hypothetical protein [Saccharofermentans sp.]
MGLFTEKYNTPFDNEADRQRIKQAPSALHVSAPSYLTTRSALFMGFALISLCLLLQKESEPIWVPLAISFAGLLIWSVTLRFFMPRKLAPLTLLIVELIYFALSFASHRFALCSSVTPIYLVPMAMGIMMLGRFKDDGEEEYSRAKIWKEVFKPYFIAILASCFGYLASNLFEVQYVFVSLLSATMFIVVLAYLTTKFTGRRTYFTSKSLTEFWNIPVADVAELRRFVFTRLQLVIVVAGVLASLLAITAFTGKYAEYLVFPVPSALAIGLGVLMIIASRGGDRKSIFGGRFFLTESAFASAAVTAPFILSIPDMPVISTMIKLVAVVILTDIIVTGLLAVIRRRLIFVSKIRYVEGLPFYLVLVSLVLMIIEVIS